jgi:hypothetical protein
LRDYGQRLHDIHTNPIPSMRADIAAKE